MAKDAKKPVTVDQLSAVATKVKTWGKNNFVEDVTLSSGKIQKTINGTTTDVATIPTSLPNPNSLKLQAGGTDKVTYDGSSSATLNIASGSSNGTISVGGTDVSVTGLGSLAYVNSLSASDVSALPSTTKYAGSSTVGGAATSAAKLTNTSKIGDTNKPVYFTANGVPAAVTHTLNADVPSNAVFTDTKVTSSANHYTPATGETANVTATGDSTLSRGTSKVITGVTTDSKGHVVGLTTGKLPTSDNTDTSVTSVNNHYTPSADANSELTASIDGTAGAYAKNTEYTVLTGVKAQRDAAGHVTGLTYTAQNIKDTNNTYTGYNIAFQNNAGTTVDTYKALTSPSKTLKAGTNVEMSASSNVVTVTAKDTTYTISGGTNKITVTPSEGEAYDVTITPSIDNNVTGSSLTADKIVLGNGSSSVKTSSKGIVTTLGADDTTIPTSKAVQTAITNATSGLTGAMHFIGSSSTAITDGGTENPTISGYSGTAKTSGNVVLYSGKEYIWTGSAWELFGDEGSYALKTVKVEGTGALGGGGTLEENRTITHNTSGVTAGTYGPSANVTGNNNETINVPEITVDSYGHVTSVTNRTYTSKNNTYTVGSKALKVASNSGTATQAIGVNENSSDRTLTISGDGTYITGAVSGSSNSATVTLSHADPVAVDGSALTSTASSTGNYAINTEYSVVTGITLARDAKGHVTGISTTNQKIKDTNTTYTVNNGTFSVKTKVGNNNAITAADFTANQSAADDITFVQGSNITLTTNTTNRTVTIAATDTKYTAATSAPGKVATSSAQGSSTNYARQDHTHGIDLATGDSNGQVKIAGTNVSVKGLGSAAYTASTAYATNQQLASDANLNNIKTVGFYNAGGGNTITNKPSGVEHFGMEVIHYASGDYYVQIVYNNSNSWRRRCDNGTWGSWIQDKLTDTTYSAATTSAAGLMSADDKTKLNGIATGATKVTTDTVSGWGYTKNTGTITGIKMNGASKGTSGVVDLGTVITAHQDISGKVDKTTTVNGHALSANVTVTKSDVGLGNVTNDSQVKRSEMGAASGVATLDSNGKVPSSQLPSYVDDVIEGYFYNSKFYKESGHTTEITGETGKIYVDLSTNKTYRWGGSSYAVISETLALGETSSTAYRGDRGKTAYTHSQTTSGNPHNVTKSDVGLGNVGNFKAVSTVASQGLSDTEKANARTNIGAGTSSFSGSYNDLSNKPTIPAAAANGTYTVKTLVGSTTTNVSDFTANQSSADDVTFVQGSNVTITPDATNRKITIAAKDTTYGVVSTSANGLAPKVTDTSKFLKGDGTWATPTDTNNRRSFYGTCDTAAATAAKVVTLSDTSGWELKAGTIIGIKFTNTNSASNVTLNVNGSGAKSIWYNNAAYTGNSNTICGYANRVTYYMYDGTQWVWLNMGSLDGNTDTKVAQTVTTTSADYEVLFSNTADNTTRTEGARKNSNLKFNPSTGNLQATQLNGVTIGSSPKFTDTTYSSKAAVSGGTDVSLVTTGEKATWNAKTSNTGTITGIKMNGASKGTSGVVDLGTVITSLNHTVTVQSGLKSDGTTTISGTSSSAASPTVALGDSGVTAGSYGDNAAQTPSHGGKFKVPYVTVNAKGIVTGISSHDVTLPASGNTDRYVNSAAFADDSTNNSSSPVKMTLTRAGSDSATVTGNIPAVSSSSAGVAPKGAAVSTQNQSTKFLREDGSWAAPSYTTNTDAKVSQTATTTSAAYEVLFSGTADNTTRTEGARKTSTLTYNPSTKALATGGTVNGLTLSPQTTGFKISGGTTSKTLTVGADYSLAAACAKAVTDSTSASAIGTGTSLPTERDIYYGLPTINGAHNYTSNTTLFTPTSAGTAGQVLVSAGTGAPDWKTGDIIHYVTSPSGTAGTKDKNRTQWTGTVDGVTALYTGLMIMIKIPVAGINKGVTLNINSLGEHPVVLNANTIHTTHYPVGAIIPLIYDADQIASLTVNSTSTSYTGCWKIANYDSNTTYSAGTAALLTAGTDTENRVWQAKIIADYVKSTAAATASPANGGNADTVDNIHIVKITQSDYDNLGTKDENTLYIITT